MQDFSSVLCKKLYIIAFCRRKPQLSWGLAILNIFNFLSMYLEFKCTMSGIYTFLLFKRINLLYIVKQQLFDIF